MKIEPAAWLINHTGELISEDGYEPFWKAVDGNTPLYAIPETHVIVPREPTEAMIEAGRNCPLAEGLGDDDVPEDYRRVFKAMIEAAGVDD